MALLTRGNDAAPVLPSQSSSKMQSPGALKKNNHLKQKSESELMRFFLRCMKLIQLNYVDEIDSATLVECAIQGMLNGTDPHSIYFNDKEYSRLQENCKGSFGGIGVVMTNDRNGMRVISCLDDTPAAKAGILPGDIIMVINDTVVGAADGFSGISEMMRGDPGTTVRIGIERKGQAKMMYFSIKRAVISVKSVKYELNGDVAIIRIANFDEQTPDLLKKAIQDVQAKKKDKLRGYVIDLRRNPGGLVDSAVSCCQLFIDKGILLRSKARSGMPEEVKYAVPGLAMVKNKPIVVLIDEGSASASEMMAGALKDHKVAVILGVTSFGKGSTQAVMPLESKMGAIKLTTMRWYTPARSPIQGHGIVPHITVAQVKSMEPLEPEEFTLRENNFSRALVPENLKNGEGGGPKDDQLDPSRKSIDHKALNNGDPGPELAPLSKKNSATPPAANGLESGNPKSDEKEDKGPNGKTTETLVKDSISGYKELDYQMLRAVDLINGVYIMNKLNIFNSINLDQNNGKSTNR